MPDDKLRVLILGAHPDDGEYHAGGLATLHARRGNEIKLVSVTNGAAGHHALAPGELADIRRREAAEAGKVIGAVYETWDFPDGALLPTLEVRERVIREIRTFSPDLVLTHRTNDYHPDHRAVGQAVQDASFLVVVPHVAPDAPALRRDPVVAYMVDLFTKPCPLKPHVVLDVGEQLDSIVQMLACHRSQVYEWLPYLEGTLADVPADDESRRAWLRDWFDRRTGERAERFRQALIEKYGRHRGQAVRYCEAYEISEYAGRLDPGLCERLFPG